MECSVNVSQVIWVGSGVQVLWLIFCSLDLSITERRMVKSATTVVGFSISPCGSISFGFMCFEALLLGV